MPLSENEQRILRQIEQQLERDPAFSTRGYRMPRHRLVMLSLAVLGALAVTVLSLAVSVWLSLAAFAGDARRRRRPRTRGPAARQGEGRRAADQRLARRRTQAPPGRAGRRDLTAALTASVPDGEVALQPFWKRQRVLDRRPRRARTSRAVRRAHGRVGRHRRARRPRRPVRTTPPWRRRRVSATGR